MSIDLGVNREIQDVVQALVARHGGAKKALRDLWEGGDKLTFVVGDSTIHPRELLKGLMIAAILEQELP